MSNSQSTKSPESRRTVALDIYLAVARGLPEPEQIALYTYPDRGSVSLRFDSRDAAFRWAEHLAIVETAYSYGCDGVGYHAADRLGWTWEISCAGDPQLTPNPEVAQEIEAALAKRTTEVSA